MLNNNRDVVENEVSMLSLIHIQMCIRVMQTYHTIYLSYHLLRCYKYLHTRIFRSKTNTKSPQSNRIFRYYKTVYTVNGTSHINNLTTYILIKICCLKKLLSGSFYFQNCFILSFSHNHISILFVTYLYQSLIQTCLLYTSRCV